MAKLTPIEAIDFAAASNPPFRPLRIFHVAMEIVPLPPLAEGALGAGWACQCHTYATPNGNADSRRSSQALARRRADRCPPATHGEGGEGAGVP